MRRTHPSLLLTAALAVSLIVSAACGDDGDDAAGSSPRGSGEGEPIVVGGMFNLTGPAAVTGITEQRGAELAVERINADGGVGGRPIELVTEDVESNPDVAVTTARTMVRDGVDLIVGPTLASLCEGVRQITEPAEVALYCISPIPEQSELVFNIEYSPAATLGFTPAKFFAEQGWTRVACIQAADRSGEAYLSTLEAAAESFDLEVVAVETFQPGDTDVTAQLTSIRGADPDVIFSCASGGDHVTVLRGMEQLGMEQPAVLGAGGVSYEVAELAADHLSPGGVFSVGSPVLVPDDLPDDFEGTELVQDFVAAYDEAHDELPSHMAGLTYDVMHVVAAALEEADDDGPAIAAALESVCDLEGVMTTYCLSPEDHSGYQLRSPMIVRWTEEGTFSLETVLDPEGIPGRQVPA